MDSDDEDSSYILRAEREAKQNYLKEEIIENNYDPDLFMWYISSIQEADIDSWEFDQLQVVVREFKMKFRRGQTLDEVQGPLPRSDMQVKQDFLHVEVIQNGYDADLFMWFIEGLGEPDLNLWTMENLQQAVKNFKEKFQTDQTLEAVLKSCQEKSQELEKPPGKNNEEVVERNKTVKDKKKSSEKFEESHKKINNNGETMNHPTLGLTPDSPKVSTVPNRVEISEVHLNQIENPIFAKLESPKTLKNLEILENLEVSENPEKLENDELKAITAKPASPSSEQGEILLTEARPESLFDSESLLVVPCGTLSETEISLSSDLKFSCGSPKLQKLGFFSKKFIEYELSTPSLGWQVRRRYSDFIWLRDVLQSTNPGSYIPPLPSKKMMGNFEEQFLKKRSKFLNDFINTVLRDPHLRSSPELVVFLSETNANSFRVHQQSKLKVSRLSKFEEISTLNGDTICDLNEDPALFDLLSDYLDVSENLEKRLKSATKGLISSTKKASNTINEFAEMVQELQSSFFESEIADKQAEIMEKVNNMLVKWAAHEEINGKNMEDDLKLHFGFKIKEKAVFKAMLQERNSRFSDFRKVKNKKGCDEAVENAKNMFGHFNFKIRSEFERSFGDQIIYDREHFKALARHEIEKAESLEALWILTSNDFYQAPRLI